MDNVLYLDFDGVLHHHDAYVTTAGADPKPYLPDHVTRNGFRLFQYAQHLNVPENINIVLSTSWANLRMFSTAWAVQFLPDHLARKVVGRTKDMQIGNGAFSRMSRGKQVQYHAKHFKVTNWLALDDDDEGFDNVSKDRLIKTDDEQGIMPYLDAINKRLEIMSLIASHK